MPKITLPDGSVKEFGEPVTPRDVAMTISEGLANASIGALIDGERADVNKTITEDASV
ncbi:MAG: TGS domain-containing protein, partial [Planctomycetota bacterium]